MREPIIFFVAGKPQPAGSKRAFVIKKGGAYTGRAIVTDDNPKAKDWKIDVQHAAKRHCDIKLWDCPIRLVLNFTVERPKSHYGSGKNASALKVSASAYPTGKPDVLKLARGVEDALTSLVWVDDAQIVTEVLSKKYGYPGVAVEIHEVVV